MVTLRLVLKMLIKCEEIKARGGKVVREAGPMKGGVTVIAFVEDPDGYKVELIQQDANARNN